jgi:hypothetical protein
VKYEVSLVRMHRENRSPARTLRSVADGAAGEGTGRKSGRPEETCREATCHIARNAATLQAGHWRRVVMGTSPIFGSAA